MRPIQAPGGLTGLMIFSGFLLPPWPQVAWPRWMSGRAAAVFGFVWCVRLLGCTSGTASREVCQCVCLCVLLCVCSSALSIIGIHFRFDHMPCTFVCPLCCYCATAAHCTLHTSHRLCHRGGKRERTFDAVSLVVLNRHPFLYGYYTVRSN